ncbi:hypothetical protein [Halobaculum limi]|uniref:hypothetical protein n=1 Tax=Halobaculum limi TaxID=3031916 RepID=UPI002406436A|nr:hypothetical protein [Halobaculum sp. YSMS11]
MNDSDPSASDDGTAGLARMERSLRRALAVSESEEARYHIRTALQFVDVVRDDVDPPQQTELGSERP